MKCTMLDGTVVEGTPDEIAEFCRLTGAAAPPVLRADSYPSGHSPSCPAKGGAWFSVVPCCAGSIAPPTYTTSRVVFGEDDDAA